MDRIKEQWKQRLPTLTLVFCVVQPLLDVVSYWQDYVGWNNMLTLTLRMITAAACLLAGFLVSERKRYYYAAAGILGLFLLGHVLACCTAYSGAAWATGYQDAAYDLVNQVRIWLLPLTALSFISFLRADERVYPALKTGLVLALAVIAGVVLLSVVTGTDPHTYSATPYLPAVGVLGWFLWANGQSAILGMLAPVAIVWALRRWPDKPLPVALVTLGSEALLFFLGTRLAYAAIAAAGLGLALTLPILSRRNWKTALTLALCTALFLGLYPVSTACRRQRSSNERTQAAQTEINGRFGTSTDPSATVEPDSPYYQELVDTYINLGMGGPIQRFGAQRILAAYGYTKDYAKLTDQRQKKLIFCGLMMEDAGVLSRLFGLDLGDMREEVTLQKSATGSWTEIYDVENDFHGVYFLCGAVGLGLMLAFFAYFLVRAMAALLREPRKTFTADFAAFSIATVTALAHAFFTAAILRRPNVSVYLAVSLAALWYLTRKTPVKMPEKT